MDALGIAEGVEWSPTSAPAAGGSRSGSPGAWAPTAWCSPKTSSRRCSKPRCAAWPARASATCRRVLGTSEDPRLPAGSLDAVLMVDTYHELDNPRRDAPQHREVAEAAGTGWRGRLQAGRPGARPGARGPRRSRRRSCGTRRPPASAWSAAKRSSPTSSCWCSAGRSSRAAGAAAGWYTGVLPDMPIPAAEHHGRTRSTSRPIVRRAEDEAGPGRHGAVVGVHRQRARRESGPAGVGAALRGLRGPRAQRVRPHRGRGRRGVARRDRRDPAPGGPCRHRRREHRHCGGVAPSGRGVPGLPLRDRARQADRADLEAGDLRGRRGVDRGRDGRSRPTRRRRQAAFERACG